MLGAWAHAGRGGACGTAPAAWLVPYRCALIHGAFLGSLLRAVGNSPERTHLIGLYLPQFGPCFALPHEVNGAICVLVGAKHAGISMHRRRPE